MESGRASEAVDARPVSCQRSDEWWRARLEEAVQGGRGEHLRRHPKSRRDAAGRRRKRRCNCRPDGIGQDDDGADRAVILGKADRFCQRRRNLRPWQCRTGGDGGPARDQSLRKFSAMDMPERQGELNHKCEQRAPRSGPDVRSNPTHVGACPGHPPVTSIPPGRTKCTNYRFVAAISPSLRSRR